MRARLGSLCLAVAATAVSTVLTALPTTPAAATTVLNTISGVLTYEDGRPAAGKAVTLEALPLTDFEVGVRVDPILVSATTTNALGSYTLTIAPTATLIAMAQSNDNVLNATVLALFDDAPLVPGGEQEVRRYAATVGVWLDMVVDPLAPSGYAFVDPGTIDMKTQVSSVSVTPEGGDVTLTASTSQTGAVTVEASPAPEPDETAPVEETVQSTADGAGTVQESVDTQTGVSTGGLVDVDSTTVETVVDAGTNATGTSQIVNDIRMYDSDGGGSSSDPHTYPSKPCHDWSYSSGQIWGESYVTYKWLDWVTVAELHVPSDATGKVTYQTTKQTSIGFGVHFQGKAWEVSGSRKVSKTTGSWNGWTANGPYGRHIQTRFWFRDWRHYRCQGSSNGAKVIHIQDSREPYEWAYNMRQRSVNLRNWDSKKYFDRANPSRATRFVSNEHPGKSGGDGYNYKWETCIIGLCVGSETDYSTSTSLQWDFGTSRQYYWLFGNDDKPLDAHIVYAYG